MNAENSINLFSNLIYVSAAVAILGLGLAIFFFFYFKIPTVFAFLTGRAKREMIEAMSEEHAKSGKLRNAHMIGHTGPTGASGELGRTGPFGRVARTGFTGRIGPKPVLAETEKIGREQPEDIMETSVLSDQDKVETTVLNGHDETLTTVLTQPVFQSEHRACETTVLAGSAPQIRFDVTENTILIHTDEFI